MKQISTNQELVNILTDLEKQGPAFLLFNKDKIRRFYTENAVRIARVRSVSVELADKYGKKNEKGECIIDEKTNSIIFEDQETEKLFQESWAAEMEKQIEIHS